MDLAQIWFKHQKAIIIVGANVIGLTVLIVGAKLIYRATVVPEIPNIEQAAPKEVVDFVASSDFRRVRKYARRKYMRQFFTRARDARQREQILDRIDHLSAFEIEQFKANVVDVVKDQVAEDAAEYAHLPEHQRSTYLGEKLKEAEEFQRVFRGRDVAEREGKGAASRVDVAKRPKLTSGVPTKPRTIYKEFIKATNPAERAKLETYVTDLQAEADRVRREHKRQTNKLSRK